MASPNLPEGITAGVTTGHVTDHEKIHDLLNEFDMAAQAQATGDLLVFQDGLIKRLPVGPVGHVLTVVEDGEGNPVPGWAAPQGGSGGGGGLASGWQSGNVIAAAVGIPIVTSSNKQPGRVGFVIDGAITEEQYASGSAQQIGDYIEFDFGVAIELEGIRMVGLYGSNIGTDYPRGWEVLSSDTGAFSGEEIQRGTGSATGWGDGTLDTTFTAASARYWRIRLTSAAGNHWRINEVFFRIP